MSARRPSTSNAGAPGDRGSGRHQELDRIDGAGRRSDAAQLLLLVRVRANEAAPVRSKAIRRRITSRAAAVAGRGDLDGQAEPVEQLRSELALLRVHGADQHEPRGVRDRDASRSTVDRPIAAASSSRSTRWSWSRLTSST